MSRPLVTGDPGKYLPRLRGLVLAAGLHIDTRNLSNDSFFRMNAWNVTLAPRLSAAEEFLLLTFALALYMLLDDFRGSQAAASREHAATAVAQALCRLIGLHPTPLKSLRQHQGARPGGRRPSSEKVEMLLMTLAEAIEPSPLLMASPRWQRLGHKITPPSYSKPVPLYGASVEALMNGPGPWKKSWSLLLGNGPIEHRWPSTANKPVARRCRRVKQPADT